MFLSMFQSVRDQRWSASNNIATLGQFVYPEGCTEPARVRGYMQGAFKGITQWVVTRASHEVE